MNLEKSKNHPWKTGPVTRIGLGIHNICVSDASLPDLTIDSSTDEISLNWGKLLTSVYRGQYHLTLEQSGSPILPPSMMPLPEGWERDRALLSRQYENHMRYDHGRHIDGPDSYHSRLDTSQATPVGIEISHSQIQRPTCGAHSRSEKTPGKRRLLTTSTVWRDLRPLCVCMSSLEITTCRRWSWILGKNGWWK